MDKECMEKFVSYDPETGEFTWLPRNPEMLKIPKASGPWNLRYAGKRAGTIGVKGYRVITIDNVKMYEHRAVMIMMGVTLLGTEEVDHINGIHGDNRACNLRVVTRAENMRNLRPNGKNTSGYLGVSWHRKRKKWRAYCTNRRKVMQELGFFSCIKDAAAAAKAGRERHGYLCSVDQ